MAVATQVATNNRAIVAARTFLVFFLVQLETLTIFRLLNYQQFQLQFYIHGYRHCDKTSWPATRSFCRAMLCKRGLCRYAVSVCPSVRLSVCLSATFYDSVETNRRSFGFFHRQVAEALEFFNTKRHGNIPTATPPLNGGVECGG